ncbi:bile acid:sodium symporter family protein [Aureimonas glaciei]|uniref:Bile acid:sodium symporter n=1 Tax=Aureimonas glaciei TaxID=1776957 RepID=A0A916YBH2_9HYPH|nr:bile acid:sodium symporter family protein [Aureimonas glaciei]GGD37307.1 bile acid:sodium symporter [Aureimonas glaciei]
MRFRFDPFIPTMMGAIVLATFAPAHGSGALAVSWAGTIGVAGLFFGHGAALSPQAVLAGLRHWRLHVFILATTFLVFPAIVYPLTLLPRGWLPADLILGFVYLAVLPSAVSSSIAFTAMARGNVPAAICNSAGSNVFGLLLTPLLVMGLMQESATMDPLGSLRDICLGLLLPFIAGQLARPWLAGFVGRHHRRLHQYDQLVIVVVIYGAFSRSVAEGLWRSLPPAALGAAVLLCVAILTFVMAFTMFGSRHLGFSRADEIAAVFCGSKKSLASGLPLAQVLFAGTSGFGMIVLPIMLYNQIQIVVGAVLAGRYARGAGEERRHAEAEKRSAPTVT